MKKNKNSNIYRQGDVLIIPVAEIPAGLKQTKRVTLALGEVTGHHHSITDAHCKGFAEGIEALAEYLSVEGKSAELTHQEHSTISIAPGKYQVVRQVEYTPEALKNVAD
jgi:hypothetical protein